MKLNLTSVEKYIKTKVPLGGIGKLSDSLEGQVHCNSCDASEVVIFIKTIPFHIIIFLAYNAQYFGFIIDLLLITTFV